MEIKESVGQSVEAEPNWENLFENACTEVNAFMSGTTFHSMVIGMLQYGKRLHVAKPEDSTVVTPRPSEIFGSILQG
jgi:hypothetical protein|tara:strand:- start:2256 stop:2486 length:231 start_codon:yes stop_codon:yes gene_type:complete